MNYPEISTWKALDKISKILNGNFILNWKGHKLMLASAANKLIKCN